MFLRCTLVLLLLAPVARAATIPTYGELASFTVYLVDSPQPPPLAQRSYGVAFKRPDTSTREV